MTKAKQPLLSLRATGTIGDALTYRSSRHANIGERVPQHADAYTLPQAYQRWRYLDYVVRWNTLSQAQKATYKSDASRYHMTALAVYLRSQLHTLPDLLAQYHLDQIAGNSFYDSSPFKAAATNHGTISTTGCISTARLFDGVDDYIDLANPAHLRDVDDWTWHAYIYPTENDRNIYYMKAAYKRYMWVEAAGAQITAIRLYSITNARASSLTLPTLNTWQTIACTFTNSDKKLRLYLNGVELVYSTQTAAQGVPQTDAASSLYLSDSDPLNAYKGVMDEVTIYERALTATELLAKAGRRYP